MVPQLADLVTIGRGGFKIRPLNDRQDKNKKSSILKTLKNDKKLRFCLSKRRSDLKSNGCTNKKLLASKTRMTGTKAPRLLRRGGWERSEQTGWFVFGKFILYLLGLQGKANHPVSCAATPP